MKFFLRLTLLSSAFWNNLNSPLTSSSWKFGLLAPAINFLRARFFASSWEKNVLGEQGIDSCLSVAISLSVRPYALLARKKVSVLGRFQASRVSYHPTCITPEGRASIRVLKITRENVTDHGLQGKTKRVIGDPWY
jgi:hypothetical protein